MFINALIAFLLIAAVVFFLAVKPVNALVERLVPTEPVDRLTRECPQCLSDVSAAASRCAFCTAAIEPQTDAG